MLGGPATGGNLAGLLKSWAVEEGFSRAGTCRLEKSEQHQIFRRWLERGDHASMAWLEKYQDKREDPAKLLEGAKSALCVALQYWPLEGEEPPQGDLWPKVARYARGRDYHELMTKGLRRLGERIEAAFPGTVTRGWVDTGPILERELAARAGLGRQGKNTNLLQRGWGSYFLLGELFTSLELEPDPPVADLCRRCTRCLDACPTGALPEPYRLDASRCISYWTIEHRGDLPEEIRPQIGEWVFGCDICQEVCPYNVRAQAGGEARLRLPDQRRELDLAGLLALGEEGWVEKFQVSAMKRAKLEGLKRNAAVVMGNRRDPAYVGPLARALEEGSPMVRRHAAWALGRIGGEAARRHLETAGSRTEEPEVQAAIAAALSALGGDEGAGAG
jgi:epoxyqueuosine reductase